MNPRNLAGNVVAVVGATGVLGGGIADALAARGAHVIRVGRRGGDVTIDLQDAEAGEALVAYAIEHHGRLDGVVVASGVVAFGQHANAGDAVIEELFLTNAVGPLWLAKRVLPALAQTKGFFAQITGVVASMPMPGMVAYSASKAAAAAGLAALARETRSMGVTVIDLQPPHTETGLATRPIEGTAPALPRGLEPAVVVERILSAIEQGQSRVLAAEFTS